MNYYIFLLSILGTVGLMAQSNASCACCAGEYRQFDFWLGDWETTANGKLAGTNRIIIMQDSCVIQENWISATGNYSGTSYNYYDPQDQKWHQTWVDNQGQSLRLTGQLEAGNMVLKSAAMKNQNGETVFHRITWSPAADGTVRQHWQSHQEGSEEWQTLFDGIYRKK